MTSNIVYAIKCRDKYVSLEDLGSIVEVSLSNLNVFTFGEIRFSFESSANDALEFIKLALNNNDSYGMYDTGMITVNDYNDMKIVKLEVNFNYEEI